MGPLNCTYLSTLGQLVRFTFRHFQLTQDGTVFIVGGFLILLEPDSCVSWQAMLKSMSAHIGHCGPKARLRSEEHLNLFNSHCYSFMKTNLTIIKAYQTLKVLLATTIWPTKQHHYITEVD